MRCDADTGHTRAELQAKLSDVERHVRVLEGELKSAPSRLAIRSMKAAIDERDAARAENETLSAKLAAAESRVGELEKENERLRLKIRVDAGYVDLARRIEASQQAACELLAAQAKEPDHA